MSPNADTTWYVSRAGDAGAALTDAAEPAAPAFFYSARVFQRPLRNASTPTAAISV